MATCPPCNEANLPQCGDPLRLICLQNSNDTAPIAAWYVPVCVEGEVVSFDYFQDEAGTIPLVGYTMADRVNCPADMRGINCDVPVMIDFCPATSVPLLAALADIEASVDEQTPYLQDYDSVGAVLPANFYDLPQTLTYNVDDNVETITVTDGADTWVKTFTYTGLNVTGISGWVVQP